MFQELRAFSKSIVLESLENVFGVEQKDFHIEQVPGHFNNPILLISSKLKKKNAEQEETEKEVPVVVENQKDLKKEKVKLGLEIDQKK